MPIDIPRLVQIAPLFPYLKHCLTTKIKSGPGLATANKCKEAMVKNSTTLVNCGLYF